MKAFALTAALAFAALMGAESTASADHWRQDGGHGRWRGGYERYDGVPGRRHGYDWRQRFVERYGYQIRPYRSDGDRRERWISRYRSYPGYGYDRY